MYLYSNYLVIQYSSHSELIRLSNHGIRYLLVGNVVFITVGVGGLHALQAQPGHYAA
jgi:hypothetical protein